jgi:hypothetical protein
MIKQLDSKARKEQLILKLQKELDARDYRALKAVREKFQSEIEKMYPGETEWYNKTVEKINLLREGGSN